MERIRQFLYENNKASPVIVPRVLKDMVSRYVCPTKFMRCFASLVTPCQVA
jgi:aarF domain-containing kinase